MADFLSACIGDPSVSKAARAGNGPIGVGSVFELVARVAGRVVPLDYMIVEHDPPRRVVLEARGRGFVSRDTIALEPAAGGSEIAYGTRRQACKPR